MALVWEDITTSDLWKILAFRLLEVLAMRTGSQILFRGFYWWLKILLAAFGNLDWVYLYYQYLSEDGFLHLRFVQIIEKDGRKDGKREPLYFIGHELDRLRYFSGLERDNALESRKKYCLTGLMMTKGLLYFTDLEWLCCLALPQLIFVPEMMAESLQDKLKEFEKKAREEKRVIGHHIGDEFETFEKKRWNITALVSISLVLILPVFTCTTYWTEKTEWNFYIKSFISSTYGILVIAVVGKLLVMTSPSIILPDKFQTLKRTFLISLSLVVGLACDNKFPLILSVGSLLLSKKEKYNELVLSTHSIVAVLYSSILGNFEFGLLDLLFIAALVFLHQVGKYRPGAVKLSDLFSFMYREITPGTFKFA